tara:strand:- start:1559 stop:1861 length:303 start_codon:yes stop_codon:yes gene_type:complete
MGWSKVNNKHKKPLKWWIHKFLCEIGWIIRNNDDFKLYYFHLSKLLRYGYNLYGDKTQPDYTINSDSKIEFTLNYHQKRGYCCGNGCRNCGYKDKSCKIV